ncbi:MAG: glycosyltransferase family 2 protein [Candidatus Andersenbacteria bacterium]
MSHRVSSLSVVLPAFNEAAVIASLIERSAAWLTASIPTYEIIVINDGSTDQTSSAVRSLQARYPTVRLLEHSVNKGYGEALRTGFNTAKYDWILLMDADGQFTIESLVALLPETAQHDFISGIRERRADSVVRTWLTRGYFWLTRQFFDLPLRDPSCGFKLFRRDVWARVQPIQAHDNKVFTIEWLLKVQEAGARMAEVPIEHLPRTTGQATGGQWQLIVPTLLQLSALRRRFRRASL